MYSGERFIDLDNLLARVRICNYLTVAQIFLQDNFLLESPLKPADIKPRLLGHCSATLPLFWVQAMVFLRSRLTCFMMGN